MLVPLFVIRRPCRAFKVDVLKSDYTSFREKKEEESL